MASHTVPNARAAHHFYGANFGAADPYVTMASGTIPAWNPRDPRSQLTNVASMVQRQTHPMMNGAGLEGFSLHGFWAWLRGER